MNTAVDTNNTHDEDYGLRGRIAAMLTNLFNHQYLGTNQYAYSGTRYRNMVVMAGDVERDGPTVKVSIAVSVAALENGKVISSEHTFHRSWAFARFPTGAEQDAISAAITEAQAHYTHTKHILFPRGPDFKME